jgi:peptide deformylase
LSREQRLSIRLYGDPVLRRTADTVTDFSERLRTFVDSMVKALIEEDGLGLAAPQVGVSERVVIIDRRLGEGGDDFWPLVNPEIIERQGECTVEEGCLSLPDIYDFVTRPETVRLKYQDVTGTEHVEDVGGMLARVVQHETDHLNGILFIDRLSAIKRQLLAGTLRNLAEKGANG